MSSHVLNGIRIVGYVRIIDHRVFERPSCRTTSRRGRKSSVCGTR